MSRRRVLHWSDDSDDDDDDFPDLANLAPKIPKALVRKDEAKESVPIKAPASAVRQRKLGQAQNNNGNPLLRAWTPDQDAEKENVELSSQTTKSREVTVSHKEAKVRTPRNVRVELRTRKSKPPPSIIPSSPKDGDGEEEYLSAQEEVEISIIEDVSLFDDTFHTCEEEDSESGDLGGDTYDEDAGEDEDDSDEDFLQDTPPRRQKKVSETTAKTSKRNPPSSNGSFSIPDLKPATSVSKTKSSRKATEKDITNDLSKLQLDEMDFLDDSDSTISEPYSKPSGLTSPTKLPRIPSTPHHASTDIFWSQEFVDDWNDQHSPVKKLFPDPATAKPSSRGKKKSSSSSEPKPKKNPSASTSQSKKAFSSSKETLAQSFLTELDTTVTSGQLASLSASTGGVQLLWTNKLSTTAGRANWKRTTTKSPLPQTHHHASIELSTKIISDPNRLLNVIAHEFCHLANFMISGVTTNPHGKEFKAWAAKVTANFGESHGIEVTTKHSYEIDFKYVWSCQECATEFKRHSKSIDTSRHRCGVCKGPLVQIKPAPRGNGAKAGGGKGEGEGDKGGEGRKQSEYQVFMKEEMRRVKQEQPGLRQNEVMKVVAARWKVLKEKREGVKKDEAKEVENGMERLEVIDLT
ncbi:SprT-like family-domain-containing protein [Cladorrhinum samala]|uniref:SprT-like family-domain-containing protein n=1 Tax=Cladorrhinum samala TaxID=585594 RepID=A0AAV9HSI4_9PEZI|nr:SprT-like family-domain-containing protein [Cladorrhinum samala]